MVIDVYTADELVPQGEMFQALQKGTIDACVSDDDSMASPVDVAVFGAYFPFASRYGLDVDVLWNWYGLNEIWKEAYGEIEGVTWLSQGSWDPCNFATTKPIRHLADLKGLRMYMFPTGGKFMKQFGVVPMSMPYEDVEMAIQTGMLDGVCWSGITEDYTVGWADVTQVLPDQPHLRRLGRRLVREHQVLGEGAPAPAADLQADHREVALLPAALVLVG